MTPLHFTLSAMLAELPPDNMAMENPPFEDVVPIEDGDFPLPC